MVFVMHDVSREVAIHNMLREKLAVEFGLESDDQALIDTLEGLSHLPDIVIKLVREATRAEAFAEGLAQIIKDNAARKARLEHKSKTLRGLANTAMTEGGLTKIEECDMVVSLTPGRASVVITDTDAVPDELCKITREPRKSEIGELLKAGEFIPYATLSNPGLVLKVTTR